MPNPGPPSQPDRVALSRVPRVRRAVLAALSALAAAVAAGCQSGPSVIEDPVATLSTPESGSRAQLAAMAAMGDRPADKAYVQTLERVVWKSGYTPEVRVEAIRRLQVLDLAGLKRTIRQHLPRMSAWEGVTRICEIIADEGWTDLAPALVSSWAIPRVAPDDEHRPEYLALARLVGAENVPDTLFAMFVTSNRVSDQGLRTRIWELLNRLGYRQRLLELLRSTDIDPSDGFLLDLQAGARELGVVPWTREEILWLRKLRQPERQAFWNDAVAAVAGLSPERRAALEMRDLPIVVSAARYEPDLLEMSNAEIYARLESALAGRKHYSHGSNFDNFNPGHREQLYEWRTELTWGDLAAMLMAVRALEVPQVVDHLFDFAERDRQDLTTEYGGVIALDAKGRFEILEFIPRVRENDVRFNASQAMFDAGYTSLFHFHFHAQRYRNERYAGPGFGDVNYADATRTNCLVFTFVGEGRMNVDYYRHGRVLVDLGVIEARS